MSEKKASKSPFSYCFVSFTDFYTKRLYIGARSELTSFTLGTASCLEEYQRFCSSSLMGFFFSLQFILVLEMLMSCYDWIVKPQSYIYIYIYDILTIKKKKIDDKLCEMCISFIQMELLCDLGAPYFCWVNLFFGK